jgi:hypothetical protein
LHDQDRVPVAILWYLLELGNRIILCLPGEAASEVRAAEPFMVEVGEVEGKAETDGIYGGKFGGGDIVSGLLRLERLVGELLLLVVRGDFGKIVIAITILSN